MIVVKRYMKLMKSVVNEVEGKESSVSFPEHSVGDIGGL